MIWCSKEFDPRENKNTDTHKKRSSQTVSYLQVNFSFVLHYLPIFYLSRDYKFRKYNKEVVFIVDFKILQRFL